MISYLKLVGALLLAAGAIAVLGIPAVAHAQQQKRPPVIVGAERSNAWLPLLRGSKVALLANHTARIDSATNTLDLMRSLGVDVTAVMTPEHGFRGTAAAGEDVASGVDSRTGVPLVSLYGPGRKENLRRAVADADVVVVDLQDVGVRFYTYHITMLDAMAEAARQGKKVVVFDRPNPLGNIIDGPMLEPEFRSGVGRIPVPMVHGLTMGEIAMMANSEGWLGKGTPQADLTVVTSDNYTHSTPYELPVAPSPNLPNMQAIYLYPSLCLFEGTNVSLGRGTPYPFQVYGHPDMTGYLFSFTPRSCTAAPHPPQEGKLCHGMDLRGLQRDSILKQGVNLEYVIDAYNALGKPGPRFFTKMFNLLAGTDALRQSIIRGDSPKAIRKSWQKELNAFRSLRSRYLLYPE